VNETLLAVSVFVGGVVGAVLIRWLLRALVRRLVRAAPWLEAGPFGRNAWRVPIEAVFVAGVVAAVLGALRLLSSPVVASALDQALALLPRLLLAFVVLCVGIVGGRLVRNLIQREGTRDDREIARMTEVVIVLLSSLIALGSVGLQIVWLAVAVAGLGIVALAGLLLVLALGSVPHMENLIAMRVMRERVTVGDRVRVAGIEGRVVELTNAAALLDTEDGLSLIPGSQLQRQPVLILRSADSSDG
jgi:hypothetical protein